MAGLLSSFPPAVAVPENGHLAFVAPQEAADIFLVSEKHKQGYSDGKDPVNGIVHIKDHKYEHREGYAGQYGTE